MIVPVSAEKVASGSITLDFVELNAKGELFFLEGRPEEKGRQTLLKMDREGTLSEITPFPLNIKSRVHEYGGKPYTLLKNGVAFLNDQELSLYIDECKITDGTIRFAECIEVDGGLIGVAEKGEDNFLAFIELPSGKVTPLFSETDFVAAPTLSPNGKKLAWMTWDHPYMPWEATKLWIADLKEGHLSHIRLVVGGESCESIFQPGFSPSNDLLYMSDRSGFWNLYQDETPLFPIEADCGRPLWSLGMRTWDIQNDDLVLSFHREGVWKVAHRISDGRGNRWMILPFECADISSLRLHQRKIYFAASFKDDSRHIVSFDLATWEFKKIYGKPLDIEEFSFPEILSYYSGGEKITAFYYPPIDPEIKKPPLLVKAHGGPTGHSSPAFNWTIAYWTSHGFGYLDVNYRGSSGSGRKFRESLNGHFGLYDWQDCERGAAYLVEKGVVDPEKLFMTGGSSAGYTVLGALTLGTLFKGGTSYYGVSDLELLKKETHKFESHYIETLTGTSPTVLPLEKLQKPLLFLHGTEDKIVPPDQPLALFKQLKNRKVTTDLLMFEGEGHGFRRRENIIKALEKERAFYNSIK